MDTIYTSIKIYNRLHTGITKDYKIRDMRVYRDADYGSDHYLVKAKLISYAYTGET